MPASTSASAGRKAIAATMLFVVGAFAQASPKFRVLVFNKPGTKSDGGKIDHASIVPFSNAIVSWGKELGFDAVPSVNGADFTADNLAKFQVVMFNNSPILGNSLNADQRAAFLAWAKTNGTVALHSAGDQRNSWPDYSNNIIGADFNGHGTGNCKLTLDPEAKDHPLATGAGLATNNVLEETINVNDEIYSFSSNPRGKPGIKILYTGDEKTFPAEPKMGADHPLMWLRDFPEGGRMFYSSLGHSASFATNAFHKKFLVNSFYWSAKVGSVDVRGNMLDYAVGLEKFTARSHAPSALTVTLEGAGLRTLELNTLGGRRVARLTGEAGKAYTLGNLNSSTVYTLTVRSASGSQSQLARVR